MNYYDDVLIVTGTAAPQSHNMKRLSGVALVIYVALPKVKYGVFVYKLIWIIFQEGCSLWECTHTNTQTQIPRLSCIMHLMSCLDCTVVVALTMISDYFAFSTSYKHTAGGDCYPKQIPSPQTICPILRSFRQSRRDGGVFCALQT